MADFSLPTFTPGPSFMLDSAATTNATLVKAGPGTVFSITATNQNAAARFLKIYNKVSAPTVGTDIPVLTISLPAASATAANSVNIIFTTNGLTFSAGIGIAITGAVTDADTTAVALHDVKVAIAYA